MKSLAFFLATAACAAPAVHAQSTASSSSPSANSSASGGTFGRIVSWWSDDWTAGWETGSNWRVTASPYTYHYTYSPEHTHVYMLGIERHRADGFLFGGSVFKNSFGQPSVYGYVGQQFDRLLGIEPLFAQLTGGILYGYKPPFDRKVPLNYRGFSPGFVASVGWQLTPAWSAQVNLLGNSALMFQFSVDLK